MRNKATYKPQATQIPLLTVAGSVYLKEQYEKLIRQARSVSSQRAKIQLDKDRIHQVYKITDDQDSARSKTETVGIADTFRNSIVSGQAVTVKKMESKTAQTKTRDERIMVVNHCATIESGL